MGNDAPPDLLRARVGAPAGSICSARGRSTMNSYRYEIGLRMRHPSPDPAEITCAPRLDPSRYWHAHEPRTAPTGRPLEGPCQDREDAGLCRYQVLPSHDRQRVAP